MVNCLKGMKSSGVYDAFTKRHQNAMMSATLMAGESTSTTERNVAHVGPAFLPWHRQLLLDFVAEMRKFDATVELPYLPTNTMGSGWRTSPAWSSSLLGGNGSSGSGYRVQTGPFASWNSVIYNYNTRSFQTRTGIIRRFSSSSMPGAPSNTISRYDSSPWNESESNSTNYRVSLEQLLHDAVHNIVGGDMTSGTAPNDPVFYLHHANVDRLWSLWQAARGTNGYTATYFAPQSGGPLGHNLNDNLRMLVTTDSTPMKVLDHRPLYVYEAP